ncbi:hypothetical protein CLAIMM_09850 [Cladophialophora immunda]|nr:hypothetical protein CLAIMM_09850 [Cladophialophora immunda]
MLRSSLISPIFVLLFFGKSLGYGGFAANAVGGGSSLRRRQYGTMGHGAYGMFEGVEYRWHQIYDGMWVGVDPSEWDDTVHTQNNAPPPWVGPTTEPTTSTSTLKERDLVANICKAGNACLTATQNAAFNIRTAATQFFTNLAQTQQAQAVLNFLSKPVIQKVTIEGVLNGAISGLVGGFVQQAAAPNGPPTLTAGVSETSVCSTEKDALDAVISLLQQQATQFEQMNSALGSIAQELSAIKISIGSAVNSQEFITVTVATIECGETVGPTSASTCDIALNTC